MVSPLKPPSSLAPLISGADDALIYSGVLKSVTSPAAQALALDDPEALRAAGGKLRRGKPATDASTARPDADPQISRMAQQGAPAKPGMTTEEMIGKATNGLLVVGMGAPMVPTVTGWVGNGLNKLGGAANLVSVKNAGQSIVEGSAKAGTTTFSDLGKRMPGVAKPLNRVSQFLADGASSVAGPLLDATGFGGRLSARAGRNADRAAASARVHAESVIDILHREMGGAPHEIQYVKDMMETVRDAPTAANLAERMPQLKEAGEALTKAVDKNPALESAIKPLRKTMDKAVEQAGKAASLHADHLGMQNVRQTVKNAPQAIAKSSITHGMMNGAFIGIESLAMFGIANTFAQNLESLKAMKADIDNEDPAKISTFAVLTGKVPPVVAEARSALLKQAGVQTITQAASFFLTIKNAVKNNVGFLPFIAAQGISAGAQALIGESIVPVYAMARKAHAGGQKIPEAFYAEFLMSADKEFKGRGATGQEMAKALAAQYASENAAPGQILKEMSNGKLEERVKGVIAKSSPPPEMIAAIEPGQVSMTNRLQQTGRAARPEVGDKVWTSKLNKEVPGAALQAAAPMQV